MSSIVLAGGRSSRLGQDKTKLIVGGVVLLHRTVRRLGDLGEEVILVLAPGQEEPRLAFSDHVSIVRDEHAHRGPLVGLYSGLKSSRDDKAVTVGCDMPFLNVDLLRYMRGLAGGVDAVIPKVGHLVEPLHAVYSRSCLEAIEDMIATGDFRLRNLLDRVTVRYVEGDEIDRFDPEHLSWFNINTPEDLARAEARIEREANA